MRRGLFVAAALIACKREPGGDGSLPAASKPLDAAVTMTVTTPAWLPGQKIPKEFTCDGDDKSPEVKWANVPKEAKSFLLIVDDPDAPSGTFTHWVIFDMPAPANHLPEAEVEGIGTVCKNDFGNTKWNGPCPPKGKEHRYFFRVYALDVEKLDLEDGCSRGEVERKIDGHVLARAETMGTFLRQ
jgi:Raf kinase inhibitor-like YbhB/YbcL family protein